MERREILETEHGVVLYPPTKARPYYRAVWRDVHGARQQTSAGKDPDAAWAKAVAVDEELSVQLADPTGRTVGQLAEAWLADMGEHWSRLHADKGRDMVDRFVVPVLGAVPLGGLSRDQVRDLLARPTAASTRRHLRAAVGAMLTWGFDEEWTLSPREYYLPRKPRTSKRDAGRQHGESHQFIEPALRPTPAACRRLAEELAKAAGEKHAEEAWLMVAVAASCGPREGELWAAPVRAFDVKAGSWFIDRQVVRPDGGGAVVTPPKWGRYRTTLIPDDTIWGEPLLPRLAAYLDGKDPDALAFPAPRGGFFHPSNFSRDWLKPARAASAPTWLPAWKWHSLRHGFCTHMLAQGADAVDVAAAAGHKDTTVTLAMYVGQTEGALDRLRDAARRKPKKAKQRKSA